MEEHYWELFCATGNPVFYLLYRRETEQEPEAKTAWTEAEAELL